MNVRTTILCTAAIVGPGWQQAARDALADPPGPLAPLWMRAWFTACAEQAEQAGRPHAAAELRALAAEVAS